MVHLEGLWAVRGSRGGIYLPEATAFRVGVCGAEAKNRRWCMGRDEPPPQEQCPVSAECVSGGGIWDLTRGWGRIQGRGDVRKYEIKSCKF